jgi:excisionase family DNA binding protein
MPAELTLDALVDAIARQVVAKVETFLSRAAERTKVQPVLLNVKEAAIYLGRSEQSVQHLIFRREFPVVRIGRRVHLDPRDIDAWIEKNKS